MMKFGANVTQTALKGLILAQAGNYDHVLNLKYTCRALPSCFSSKKSRPLWPVMMDASALTHKKRKLVKTYKNVFPQKWTVVAEVCGETYS